MPSRRVANRARKLARRYLPPRVRRAASRLWRSHRPPRAAPAPPAAGRAHGRPRKRAGASPPVPPLLRRLERGSSLEAAVVAQVRALVAAGEHHRAQALAEGLRAHDATRTLGALAAGVTAYRRGFRELAWEELGPLPRSTWVRFAAAEYVRSGLSLARAETLDAIRELVADDPDGVPMKSWFDVLAPVYGIGEGVLARELFAIFDRRVSEYPEAWAGAAANRDWMRSWVAVDPDSPSAPPPVDGRPVFAIMDYAHPGRHRGSANIGDHVQSIAAIGHLVRHQGIRLHGREDLVELLTELRGRTRPELRRAGVDADLEVRTVHRDASMYEAIAEGTWVLCFGWYMHALFGMRHGFPLHRNLRPIFISFHCNKRDLLTPDAIAYLKRYGPVGCRDWTTVHLLLSIGVPAFFSGCLTTTIGTVFPALDTAPDPDSPIAYVDATPTQHEPAGVAYEHSNDAVRVRSFTANAHDALERLETYRREHSAVVTSRLHCYLPLRSIGADVEFRPKNPADIRFDGLLGMTGREFDAMRAQLLGRLEQVFTAILTGASEADVYALWRELTAADVAAAEERRQRPPELPAPPPGVEAELARAVAGTVAYDPPAGAPAGDTVHCAVVVDEHGEVSLSALVASLLEHASRPLHMWLLTLPGAEPIAPRLAKRFPQVGFTRVATRGLGGGVQGPSGVAPGHASVVRMLLPDLLPDVDRVIVLPLPAVATADVAELAELDLGPHALAAPRRPGTADVSGFGVIHAAALRLRDRTRAAAELRRTAHARHRFDFDAFTPDVLVLDLARLRRDGFGATALALVTAFGLDDLEVLHYVAGAGRAAIPERWAAVPTRSPARGPGLIHWADPVKPWQQELTPERERWRRYAAAAPERAVVAAPE